MNAIEMEQQRETARSINAQATVLQSEVVQGRDKLDTFRAFVGTSQRQAIYSAMQGEEGAFFRGKVRGLIELFTTMPKTYEQDGLGENAIAHLHYFTGGCDWYITERDVDDDGEGQIQAFGSANLGYGAELGYISIKEIIGCGAELDLYFTPCTLASLPKAA